MDTCLSRLLIISIVLPPIQTKMEGKTVTSENKASKSIRSDLINKTFIRSVKRYYCELLCKGYNHLQRMADDLINKCLDNIDVMTAKIFSKNYPEVDISISLSCQALLKTLDNKFEKKCPKELVVFYEIKFLLMSMLLRNVIKKHLAIKMIKTQFTSYFDLIYKYTHRKMNRLVRLTSFQLLFKNFIDDRGLEAMLETDKTLASNADKYRNVATNIVNQLI